MIKTIVQRIGLHTIITLCLLLVAINCLTAGLGTIIRGATMSAFLPVGTLAALLGWSLASGRFNGWLAGSGILILGVFLLSSTTARLGGPLLELLKLLPSISYQLFLWAHEHTWPDLSAAAIAWAGVVAPYAVLWQRVAAWVKGVQAGVEVYDPVVSVLVWSLLLWPMAAWAGWFLRRRQTLIGMAPALALLAIVGSYTGADAGPLWGLLCITLLLMGLMHYQTNMLSWARRSMDYAEIIQGDTVLAVIIVSTTLAVAAWFVPTFSIKAITDALRQEQPTTSNQNFANTLGLQQAPGEPSAFAPYRVAGLPNEHLIGAGPQLSQTLVMTIRTGELPPMPTDVLAGVVPYHHWRSSTFDGYTGSGWVSSPVESETYSANTPVFGRIPANFRLLHQEITRANGTDGKLYWDGSLYTANQTFQAGWRTQPASNAAPGADPLQGADLLGALSSAGHYQVESLLPQVSEQRLRAAPAVYSEDIVRRYLNLPKSVPERVLSLARDLTATAPTPYDRAIAIETYLRSNYPYTLDIPAPPVDRDVVDYFLFDLKKGYCDYFATSMAVLARAAGLPSRIVVGYSSGHYDPFRAEYDITQANAHAWTEIYFSGIGWMEFEPTPTQPGIGRIAAGTAAGRPPASGSPQNNFGNFSALAKVLPGLTIWTILGILTLVTLAALLQVGEYWLLTSTSTIRAIRWMYRGVYLLGRGLIRPSATGETTSEFAAALQAKLAGLAQRGGWLDGFFLASGAELDQLTGLYLLATYAPYAPQPDELRRALRVWQRLRWRLLLARLMPATLKRP